MVLLPALWVAWLLSKNGVSGQLVQRDGPWDRVSPWDSYLVGYALGYEIYVVASGSEPDSKKEPTSGSSSSSSSSSSWTLFPTAEDQKNGRKEGRGWSRRYGLTLSGQPPPCWCHVGIDNVPGYARYYES